MLPAHAVRVKNINAAAGQNKFRGTDPHVTHKLRTTIIMAESIIILTGKAEWPFLRDVLKEQAPELRVSWAPNGQELEYTCGGQDVSAARLISYCSSVIVRPEILNLFQGPAYNFHPGPPSYPGVHPAHFAIYDGATRYGVTAHIMTADIDGGPLVGVDWFDISSDINIEGLEEQAFTHLFKLFTSLSPALVDIHKDLPILNERWSGRRRTIKEFEAIFPHLISMSD